MHITICLHTFLNVLNIATGSLTTDFTHTIMLSYWIDEIASINGVFDRCYLLGSSLVDTRQHKIEQEIGIIKAQLTNAMEVRFISAKFYGSMI